MEATVVSFLPWALNELKPGLIPEQYYIPPCEGDKPAILHVNDAKSNLYVRDGKTYPITHLADEVANAIVSDYYRAQLQADDNARPALFWVYGKLTADEVMGKYNKEVALAKQRQNAWFVKLIQLADDDWARYGQHRMITDLQRHAARSLGWLTRPWMQNQEPSEFVKCPACATLVNTTAAVCANCGYVTNPVKAKELGISGNMVQTRG